MREWHGWGIAGLILLALWAGLYFLMKYYFASLDVSLQGQAPGPGEGLQFVGPVLVLLIFTGFFLLALLVRLLVLLVYLGNESD